VNAGDASRLAAFCWMGEGVEKLVLDGVDDLVSVAAESGVEGTHLGVAVLLCTSLLVRLWPL